MPWHATNFASMWCMAQKDKSVIFGRAEVFCLPVGTVHTWDSAGVLVSVLVLIVLYCCRTAPCCMRGDSNTAALCWYPLHSGAWLSLLCWPNLWGIMLVVAGNSAKGVGHHRASGVRFHALWSMLM